MLKLWLGKDGGSIIVSKSDPQHDFMKQLGFKLVIGFDYASLNRLDPGDYTIYRAKDYLGDDSIYRCMRINDDTDQKYMALKKDRLMRSRMRKENKIILSMDQVIAVNKNDLQFLACAACKRIFRMGNEIKHMPVIHIPQPNGTEIEWSYKNIVCCDKCYAIGNNPRVQDQYFAFCVSSAVFKWGTLGQLTTDEQTVVSYILGAKEAKLIERNGA